MLHICVLNVCIIMFEYVFMYVYVLCGLFLDECFSILLHCRAYVYVSASGHGRQRDKIQCIDITNVYSVFSDNMVF